VCKIVPGKMTANYGAEAWAARKIKVIVSLQGHVKEIIQDGHQL